MVNEESLHCFWCRELGTIVLIQALYDLVRLNGCGASILWSRLGLVAMVL